MVQTTVIVGWSLQASVCDPDYNGKHHYQESSDVRLPEARFLHLLEIFNEPEETNRHEYGRGFPVNGQCEMPKL